MSPIIAMQEAKDPAIVGGKAAALARLALAGFAPPPFVVVPTMALEPDSPTPLTQADIHTALARLGPGPYAVRSSARAEDGHTHSHAGQFETLLNISADDVMAAVRRVWQSGGDANVAVYRAETGVTEDSAPAVIIQSMIDADAAGVAFTADPVSGRRDRVLVSAVAGLADGLVAGEEDGEAWVLDHHGHILSHPDAPAILTEAQAQAIAALAVRAEAAFGSAQDVEWALDATGLHILQSRPITTPLRPKPAIDNTLTVFDNSNIVESYPGLVSPLTYSFAVHVYARVYAAFLRLLGVPPHRLAAHADIFDNMLARIDGRVYYNLGQWYRALALLPGFAANRSHMETMMGVDEPLPEAMTAALTPPLPQGWARWQARWEMLRAGLGLAWQALWLPRTKARFYARLDAVLDSRFDADHANLSDLAAEYRRVESLTLDRWDAPLINDFLCMIAFGASRKVLEAWLGPAGLQLHNDVLIGQGDIISAEPAQRIAQIGGMLREAGVTERFRCEGMAALDDHPDIAAEIQAYLQKFGDRCTEELKLESIPLAEAPEPLFAALCAAAERRTHTAPARAEPDWGALFARRPLRRVVARVMLSLAKARVRDRENLRFQRMRIFGLARRLFRAMGREFTAHGMLDHERDVFWLTKSDVLAAIEGHAVSPDLKGLVARRKAEDAASAERPDPPERIMTHGPVLNRAQTAAAATSAAAAADPARTKTALGCSAGQVTATARVIRDPRHEALAEGEILVARSTDPGWIAVFANAAAIVVERGSLLSHSAIVARELGIPCVVGLKGATAWVQSGETLRVDGASGTVERMDADPDPK